MAMGRPLTLGMTHRVRDDGSRETVGDAIASAIRAGNYVETAAKRIGVSKVTVYAWMQRGARARRQAIRSETTVPPTERIFVDFLNSIEEAEAFSEAQDVALMASLARGGIVERTTTIETSDGREVKRTVKETHTLPSERVLMWRLERRFPKRWGHAGSLDGSGDGAPLVPREDRAASLAAELRGFAAGVEAAEQVHGSGKVDDPSRSG